MNEFLRNFLRKTPKFNFSVFSRITITPYKIVSYMARLARFERATAWFVAMRSIQ